MDTLKLPLLHRCFARQGLTEEQSAALLASSSGLTLIIKLQILSSAKYFQ
jgi:hypothetical protein